jgi:ABC-type glycerol-3-phosphate transport system permease component
LPGGRAHRFFEGPGKVNYPRQSRRFTNFNYPELMAASLLVCLPMILIYLIFQRQFIQGIAASGGKL